MGDIDRRLRGNALLSGAISVKTGLHIGAPEGPMRIGGIDKQVVRDPVSQHPFIPGTSLRGKLRSILERVFVGETFGGRPLAFARSVGGRAGNRHECDRREEALTCPVCRVFGSTGRGNEGSNHPARLLVRDAFLEPESAQELQRLATGLFMTEWKFENALDRITSAANPRQLERVPAGSRFLFEMVYTSEGAQDAAQSELQSDLQNLLTAMRWLEDSSLGGHGARGYGQIGFERVALEWRSAETYRRAGSAPIRLEIGSLGAFVNAGMTGLDQLALG